MPVVKEKDILLLVSVLATDTVMLDLLVWIQSLLICAYSGLF